MADEINGATATPATPAGAVPPPQQPAPAQAYVAQPAAQPIPVAVPNMAQHAKVAYHQKAWFWVVLAVAAFIICLLASLCGSLLSRSFLTVNRGMFPSGTNGSGMRYYNGNGGSGNGSSGGGTNGYGMPNGNGNGNSGTQQQSF